MHFSRLLMCAGIVCGFAGVMNGCKDNAVAPPIPDNRIPIFKDSFETAEISATYKGYRLSLSDPYMPFWTVTSEAAHSGNKSAKSNANFTGMKKDFDTAVSGDTVAVGCEFYLLAKQAGRTNFAVFLGQSGGSAGGSTARVGMGIDTSDSIKCIFFDGISSLDYKTVAAITPGHWYKCRAEYSFSTLMASFFLDDVKVGSEQLINIFQLNEVVAYRDSSGSQGPKEYYLDDLFCYKLKQQRRVSP